jgi:hypothetical protein
MLGKDNDRKSVFEKSCPDCQAIDSTEVCSVGDKGEKRDDALCTPKTQIIKPQLGEFSDGKGQWTLVAKRKKSKPKVFP